MAKAELVVELVSAVVLRPGSKLVVAYSGQVTLQQADAIKEKLAEKLPGVEAVVIGGVSQLMAYEPEEMREAGT